MTRGRVLALLALVAGSLSACGTSDTTATTELPTCSTDDQDASNGVVLMAQSVPTASWVPCLRTALPLGWSFHHLDARNDVSRFWLDSDRDGQEAVEVRLERDCDTAGATEVPSDPCEQRGAAVIAVESLAHPPRRPAVRSNGTAAGHDALTAAVPAR